MASSPAKAHYQRVTAAQAAEQAAPAASMAGLTAYELQLAQLHQDRLRLKNVQSNTGKAELKRQLLPAYTPYVQGVLESGKGAQDDVLTTVMLWCIDAGDHAGALDIAAYALAHKLKMPDRFARSTGCLIAEEIAETALNAMKAGSEPDRDLLQRTAELTAEHDMPDEARAKLYMALGRATLLGLTESDPGRPGQVHAGIELLRQAVRLHDKCGVKKDLEAAERLLKKITPV
ncbi:phage terminase small subunit [Pseudomonas japonica]|uniref:phage terminase small subunit n=1 Tax=Pseudomonas japonica TaxID=256466 RepID=UPI0015E43AF9|nr:terminase endonuclease subunit [Pseudomonas japonica]MBA1289187.1 terminase endonuclease subunit [Pseudomonas japonica]